MLSPRWFRSSFFKRLHEYLIRSKFSLYFLFLFFFKLTLWFWFWSWKRKSTFGSFHYFLFIILPPTITHAWATFLGCSLFLLFLLWICFKLKFWLWFILWNWKRNLSFSSFHNLLFIIFPLAPTCAWVILLSYFLFNSSSMI